MTNEEKIAMYRNALADITVIKGLSDGTFEDLLYEARAIAAKALRDDYYGYKAMRDMGWG